MIARYRPLLLALATVVVVCAGARAEAAIGGLDPFRKAGASSGGGISLNPFRVAQAAPGTATSPAASPSTTATTSASTTTSTSTSTSTTTSTGAGASTAKSCRTDEDCPAENICQNQVCQAIQISTNVAYLYYREGSFTEVLGLYWSKTGASGYRVVAPLWWHFWSPQSQTRIFAPFFWRFEDYVKRSTLTVIVPGLPVSWSSEPGARSFGVWPLFYASTKFGWALPLLGTFAVGNPDTRRAFGAAAFIYWWKRTPDHDAELVFPLAFSSRHPTHSFSFALPLNFFWSEGATRSALVPPLAYAHWSPKSSAFYTLFGYGKRENGWHSGSGFWIYWGASGPKGNEGYDVLFPLYWDFRQPNKRASVFFPLLWHFRDGEYKSTVFFPLVWSFRSPGSNTTLAVNWLHLRRGDWRFDTIFPVWWSASDKKGGFDLVVPLFFWSRTTDRRQATLITPLGFYDRDENARSKTWGFLPFFFYRRDPTRTLSIISPLYISHRSNEDFSTTRLISLLIYLRRDGGGSTSAFIPFWWRFRDGSTGATASLLLPFYGHREGPRDETTFVGLGLWAYWRSFSGGGWSAGVFPLAYFGRNGERGHGVVFPLYWHVRNGATSTTVLFPFYYWHRDRRGGYAGGVPALLTFFGSNDGDSYAVQFPLYWRFASERQSWSTTVTPLGFLHTDRDGWSIGVGPVLPLFYLRSGKERSHAVLFPLFWRFRDAAAQSATTVVGPYVHRTVGGETTDGLLPLLWYRRGARPGGKDETSFTLFPLVHYRRDEFTTRVLTPIASWGHGPRRAAGFVGPYLWYRDETRDARLLPFLYADVQRKDTGERLRQWLIWFQVDAPGKKSRVLFPFYGSYQDEREHDTYVFPTYFRQRRTDGGAIDALLPFYWRSSGNGRATTVVGPYYDHTAPGSVHDTGFVPLWFYARNDKRSITVVPPGLFFRWHGWENGRESERMWCLLLWHERDDQTSTTVVFPLWWSHKEPDRNRQIFFPLFWHFADKKAATEKTLVVPFFWSSDHSERTRGILPIAWMSSDPEKKTSSAALMPIFYTASAPDRFTLYTLLAGYRSRPMDRVWYFWPLLFSDSVESKFGMVAPLWFSHTNKVTETTTRVVPPLLHFSRQSPDSGISTWLALFWRHHDIASSTTLGLPLFYDINEYHQSRTTLFLPLFVRHANYGTKTSYTVAPLFYRRWSPESSTTVAFPLVWDWRTGNDRRTTVVFPFYWHWRRPEYTATYVFPFLYKSMGLQPQTGSPDGTWRHIFFLTVLPVYDAAVKRVGDFRWEVLGGLFGHERIGRHRYLRLLFMTFEQEPAPRAQTSWYGKPLPVSRKAAPRGLSMNRW